MSEDSGETFVPMEQPLTGDATHSLVTQPIDWGRAFAAVGDDVYRTQNGCHWELHYSGTEPIRLVSSTFPWLTYGFPESGESILTFGNLPYIKSDLPFRVIDAADTRLSTNYVLVDDGTIRRQRFNLEQVLWDMVGPAPAGAVMLAVNQFSSPYEATHMVVAHASGPPMVTFDDGNSWQESDGLVSGADSIVTGRPVFGTNRWGGYDLPVSDLWLYVERTRGAATERVIAHSADGGLTFTDVVTADDTTLAFDDPFVIGVPGGVGEVLVTAVPCRAEFYRYDLDSDTVSIVEVDVPGLTGVASIAFNPSHPNYMFFGPNAAEGCP